MPSCTGCPIRYTNFNSVYNYSDSQLAVTLENNLRDFFNWGFLGIGAWTDIEKPTTGGWGGAYHRLRRVDDPNFTAGRVWETTRKDWVWETGVEFTGGQPIQISGVYINNTFYGTGDATYGHYFNYNLGRVVFNTAIVTTSVVDMDYSFRNIQVYKADDAPWWDELQYRSFRQDDSHFDFSGSGDWGILANHRVQLPAVVLEVVPRRRSKGYELGNSSLSVDQDVLFHILADNRWERNQLMDIISLQNHKTIWLFNTDRVVMSGVYPLDYRGMLVPNSRMYVDLVEKPYRWKRCTFKDIIISEVNSFNITLHEATVRATLEVIW